MTTAVEGRDAQPSGNIEQLICTAIALQQGGRSDLAEPLYRQILQHDPDEPDALNLLGLIEQERRNYDRAVSLLERAIAVEPEFPEALSNLARAKRAISELPEALELATRAIELAPDLAEAHFEQGCSLLELGRAREAIAALQTSLTLAPSSAHSTLALAEAFSRSRMYSDAVDTYRQALSLDPQWPDALLGLSLVLHKLGRAEEAECCLKSAAKLAGERPFAHMRLAFAFRRLAQVETSIFHCHQALESQSSCADVWLLLGSNYAALAEPTMAEEAYRRALEIEPDNIEARVGLISIGTPTDRDEICSAFQSHLDDDARRKADRIAAGFALGGLLDDGGEYGGAFLAFRKANELVRSEDADQSRALNSDALRCYINWVAGVFSKELLEAVAGFGCPSERPVFIVGMPRSGTTLVEQIIASHPHAFGAGERTDIASILNQLNGGDAHRSPRDWDPARARQLASAYDKRLEDLSDGSRRVVDKLPDNVQVLGQISVLFPRARIILCRRDLRDTCLSCYFQRFPEGGEWSTDLEACAERAGEIERLIRLWRDSLGIRMLEIDYEELVAEPEGAAKRLINYIGLEWDPACLDFFQNKRTVFTGSQWQVRQPVYTSSVGRWKNYEQWIAPLLHGLADVALNAAIEHHKAGRLAEAEFGYRAILSDNPSHPGALHLLGLGLLQQGNCAEAVQLISRAVERQPTAAALSDLSRGYRAIGNIEASILAARQAVEVEAGYADAQAMLGYALMDKGETTQAAIHMRRAVDLAPDSVDCLVGLATILSRLEDYSSAVPVWEAALQLRPDHPGALSGLGWVYGYLDRLDDAMALHQRAVDLAPEDATFRYGLAWAMWRARRVEEAVELCRSSTTLDMNLVDAWLLLANCLTTLGRFEEATQIYRRVLQTDPGSTKARHGLSTSGANFETEAELARLHETLSDAARPIEERAAAGFSLGKEYDRQGQCDFAFSVFTEANRLVHEQRALSGKQFNFVALQRFVSWATTTFMPNAFQTTAGWGNNSDVPVFIVGMPRSGTTLVEQIMSTHPQVFGAGERQDIQKIIRVLDGGPNHRHPSQWNLDKINEMTASHLLSLQELSSDAERVIDKLPDNLQYLGHIRVLFPRARIIICRRDLRDVCLSCFFQFFGDDLSWSFDLQDCGRRAREMEWLNAHWRAVLPGPVLEVSYEELVTDLEGQSRRLIDFLGLEWDPECLNFHRTERAIWTASEWQVRQPLYTSSVGRWRKYRHHLKPLESELDGLVAPEVEEVEARGN